MNPDELFEKFPDLAISSFKHQMLLGKVPAQTVQRVLEPLLTDFYEIMFQLPSHLQTDFENILRIYPEVGERFGVWIKPPVMEALKCFAKYRLKAGSSGARAALEFDMAAEPQQQLGDVKESFVKEGQGFFTTDRGTPVYIEFFYSEGDDCALFEYRPLKFKIEIHICGIYAVTLSPFTPRQKVRINNLFEILQKCAHGVEIKVIENASGM